MTKYKSATLPEFWDCYHRLSPPIKALAREAYARFIEDPYYPSLRFKKLKGTDRTHSVRLNQQYRAVGVLEGETVTWYWVGTKNEFENRFG